MRRNQRNSRKRKNTISDDTKKITSILLKIVFILLAVFLVVMVFNIVNNWVKYHSITEQYLETSSNIEENTNELDDTTQNTNEDTTFHLTAIGDIMCHNTQYMDAYNSDTVNMIFLMSLKTLNIT